jgi:WD40 repeat protein
MTRAVGFFAVVTFAAPLVAAEPGLRLKLLGTMEGARPSQYAPLAFSPDGKLLASSNLVLKANGEFEDSVKLWDVDRRKVFATLRQPGGSADRGYTVALSPDAKTLAVGGKDLVFWDVSTQKVKRTVVGRGPVVLSPDWRMYIALEEKADDEKGMALWETATGNKRTSLKLKPGVVAFSPDGKFIASGGGRFGTVGLPGDGWVELWDVAQRRPRDSLKGRVRAKLSPRALSDLHKAEGMPKRVVFKLALLNGMTFRSEEDVDRELPGILDKLIGPDLRAKYLEAIQRRLQTSHEAVVEVVFAVAFSPDGKTLASASMLGTVALWDVQTGKRLATLQRFNRRGTEDEINPAWSVAFSTNGKLLAAGTAHGIKLWDVKSGAPIGDLGRRAPAVWAVAFSPDGTTLASAGTSQILERHARPGAASETVLQIWQLVPADKTR